MTTQDSVIRAWKDPSYRASLGAAEWSALPAHPAGLVDLSEAELLEINGGTFNACVAIAISAAIAIMAVYDILSS